MNDSKLFDVLTTNLNNKHELYCKIKEFIREEIVNAKGKENEKHYDVLRKLIDSENNTGWESRHDERISLINKTMSNIVDNYAEYLP